MVFQKFSSVCDPLNGQIGVSQRTVGYNMRQEGKAVRDGGDKPFWSQLHCQRQHGTVVRLLWARIKCPLLGSSLLHSPPEVIPLLTLEIVKDEVLFSGCKLHTLDITLFTRLNVLKLSPFKLF